MTSNWARYNCQSRHIDPKKRTYQGIDVRHPHEKPTFFGMLPQHPTTKMPTDEIRQDILTARVERPDDFAPGDGAFLCFVLNMLSEKEQKATCIVIDRASMLFNNAYALHDIC